MRELRQDWRDIFGSFRVAFDVWKLLLAFAGVIITLLVMWGLGAISMEPVNETIGPLGGWLIPVIVAVILLAGLLVKFASSDTGFTSSKAVMLAAVVMLLGGLVALCMFTQTANAWGGFAGMVLLVLMIWAFFGGAITRIAAVEVANDDRIGLGEAGRFACRKYGAYLGATVLPAVAVLFLTLLCALFGLIFRIPYLNVFLSLFFFLVPLAGFLMFLVGLGGLIGSPLMYPAVSCEANDSFDAISRAYSYVFGRPWRYLFYNVAGGIYGLACSFFVAFFVLHMLTWSLSAVDYGSNGKFNEDIRPAVQYCLNPLNKAIIEGVDNVDSRLQAWDPTGYLVRSFAIARGHIVLKDYSGSQAGENLTWADQGAAWIIAIVIYGIIGLVIAYIVSLFFSIQTTIYLLLRKSVDTAEMTEVYREEDENIYAVAPESEKKADEGGEPAAKPS